MSSSAFLIFTLTLIGWVMLLRWWEARGVLDRWNASRMLGFILMVRTRVGQGALEYIARPRRFWRMWGELSLWTCRISMFAITILILLSAILVIAQPPTGPAPSVSMLVAIPGLNPIIPLGWGLVAFVVTLVMHEIAHGLLARAHGMRVRSFGLLLLGPLPLGAFAEPEREELSRAPRRERERMFAAGPASNIHASILLFVLMVLLASQFSATNLGVHPVGIVEDTPAAGAGIEPYDIITKMDGRQVSNREEFSSFMDEQKAGDTITLEIHKREGGVVRNVSLVLADRYEWSIESGSTASELAAAGIEQGDPFLGVIGLSSGTHAVDRLAGPFGREGPDGLGWKFAAMAFHPLVYLTTPLEYKGSALNPFEAEMLTAEDSMVGGVVGTAGMLAAVNLLFWLIWVNLLLGFTNLIPMVPFDGGHIFRDRIHDWLDRIRGLGDKTGMWTWTPLKVERWADKASASMSLLFLGILVLTIAMQFIRI